MSGGINIRITVRDYECDAQGIVNNAVYANYCEHARNMLIKNAGFSLHTLHLRGEDPVVVRAEFDYKYPLRGGNVCEVRTNYEKGGAFKLRFMQRIVLITTCEPKVSDQSHIMGNSEEIVCVNALIIVAILQNGKPVPIAKTVFADMV